MDVRSALFSKIPTITVERNGAYLTVGEKTYRIKVV